MKTISFTKANNDLQAVLDTIGASDDVITVKRSNADDTVIMSLQNYNSLMETLYLLKSPTNAAHLAKSIAQYENGEMDSKSK
ncbi:type II toxin-antitoxin system Phd/YefM family antitoxin [Psychrobacter sp. M13]|uniref:type II toxin-antitoxin system Phd/YefM family antitoxin n=1 Tax=Psychrobacter sp. M13 TaxID=3067275 RepID=UPI00273AC851|nr:type II toxin-antitoxin system Phd/YefM family antitoxin [Psychrobacter sp. M13]WLP93317.1 type II toxin-antitoxin system Phd/YefM family antitoxin [Psychrobacter sp. M13]